MEFISLMEIIGTVAFAVTGALVAIEKDLDYYGICFLAIITAVGGGIVRDIIINLKMPVSLDNPFYVIISLITALVVIVFYNHIHYLERLITLCDALGLAAFTAIGSASATNHGFFEPFIIITLAMLTGTGGGTIRDICAGEVPFVFEKEVYAVASLLGAIGYIISHENVHQLVAMYISFGITFGVRMVCVKKNIHLGKVKKNNYDK